MRRDDAWQFETSAEGAPAPAGEPRTVLDRLEAHARARPHKPFLVLYEGERFQAWSYRDLLHRSLAWARRLAGEAAEGGVAFLVLEPGIDAYAAFLGAMRAGLAPSFLPPPTTRQRPEAFVETHRAVFARTRPALILASAPFAAVAAEAAEGGAPVLEAAAYTLADAATAAASDLPNPPAPGATALVQHSSGTTGLKKGVALSFAAVDLHAALLSRATGLGADDVVASWLPLYHDMGLMAAFLAPLTAGASVVAMDPFAWVGEPAAFLRAVARHRATLVWTPNFALAHTARTRTVGERFDLSSLRLWVNCSEPCRPETTDRFLAAFASDGIDRARLGCCYGLAEAVFAVTQTRPGLAPRELALDAPALEEGRAAPARPDSRRVRRLQSCGPPLPGVELRIDAAPGRVGEILVRSPTGVAGYLGAGGPDPAVTAEGFRRTGDLGLIEGGELFVCGRAKERLVVHGRNLYAGDVEAAVSQVPGVRPGRVAAVALDDEEAGTEALALLLEADRPALSDADAEALKRRVRAAVRDGFDVAVREVAVGPAGWLAKSTAGKVSRGENLHRLRALGGAREGEELADEAPGVVRLPMQTLVETVARALADCFGCDPAAVTAATTPDDVAGWDSLGHTILVLRLERATGLPLGEAAAQARDVAALAARLAEAAAGRRRAAA